MTPPRTLNDYFRDILEASRDAAEFVSGMDYDSFLRDKRTQMAVRKAIEIVGEATRHIPINQRETYPEVPWKKIVGM